MKKILFVALVIGTVFSTSSFATTEATSGKSLDGYETMDMGQFKDLNKAAMKSGVHFQTQCTTPAGAVISSTDSRFSECMSQSVNEMRLRKDKTQKAQNLPGQPGAKVEFSTEL